ncbi:MAG: hypothetical protein ACREKH_06500 [Candidatus Rokuibacteriota bacterium]
MAQGLRPPTEHSEPRTRALFKADHPRDIDRHIAFFGGEDSAASDMCGEALLHALTRTGEDDEVSSCA